MKRIIMKALFYLSKKRTNKKGTAPVYCRITVNGRRSEVSTGIFVLPENWQTESLRENTKENVVINGHLNRIKADLHAIYYDLMQHDKPLSAEKIRDIFTGKGKLQYSFLELVDEYIKHKFETITEYNTVKTYNSRRALIVDYLRSIKRQQLLPEEFDIRQAELFMSYLTKKKGLQRNYINREIQFLKGVINFGLQQSLLQQNVLTLLRLKHDKPKPIIALSKKELLKLSTYKFASVRLQQVADCYVFQAFTGFAYADLVDFDPAEHIKKISGKLWIVKNRVKSDVEATVPLFNDPKRILRRYKNSLPIISLQKYNAYLKEITGVLGVKKELTTHTARKTFAMIQLNDGFSIESVAKMLGHNSIKITQSTYTFVSTNRIEAEQVKLGIK